MNLKIKLITGFRPDQSITIDAEEGLEIHDFKGQLVKQFSDGTMKEVWTASYGAGEVVPKTVPWYQSSVGEGISMRLLGSMSLFVPAIVGVLIHWYPLITVDSVTAVVNTGFAFVGALLVVWGQARSKK